MTPVFEDYLQANDLHGYMTAIRREAKNGDKESLHALLYLATQTSAAEEALDIVDKMLDVDELYATLFMDFWRKEWEKLSDEDKNDYWKAGGTVKMAHCMVDLIYEHSHPEFKSFFKRFGNADTTLKVAYMNHVGEDRTAELPEENAEQEPPEVDEKLLKYWKDHHANSDASSCQEECYTTALPYAEQGHPYAMYVIGYLLSHGIKTKYRTPSVVILEADEEKALSWLERAADAGVEKANYETAKLYWNRYYHSKEDDDLRNAIYYSEQGAEQNDPLCLEILFKKAVEVEDDAMAFGYLERLADHWGSHRYTLVLADWYEQGRGTEKNEKKAFELVEYVYKHSSISPYDSSYEDSVDKLIHYLREGIGCEKDTERAWQIRRDFQNEEDDLYELLTR